MKTGVIFVKICHTYFTRVTSVLQQRYIKQIFIILITRPYLADFA